MSTKSITLLTKGELLRRISKATLLSAAGIAFLQGGAQDDQELWDQDAPPEVILSDPRRSNVPTGEKRKPIVEGIARPDDGLEVVEEPSSTVGDSQPRRAWQNRRMLLSPEGRPNLAVRFLCLSQRHARDALSTAEAARSLHVSQTTLRRFVTGSFGYPPAALIGLARGVSLARAIATSSQSLKEIAAQHHFSSPSNMGRFFLRYSGETPGDYRLRWRLQTWLKLNTE